MGDTKIIIPFGTLKEGRHNFNFEINDLFLSQFENPEISRCNLKIIINLFKNLRVTEIDIRLEGFVDVTCDLCLENFDLPVSYNGRLFVKYGEGESDDDEVLFVDENQTDINLNQYIFESIHLSIPYKKVHPENKKGESGCNRKMIEKLNMHRVTENKEKYDPRWDNLKKININ